MIFGSVCSGIEAASVAWHPLGWRAAFLSEIEPFPSAVLAHHYPDVPNRGDMTKFQEWPDAAIDVLVGGTPCQSFSVAGLRKGLADPRGNLALVYLALADRYRPEWLVWENVPGVLSSSGGRDFGAFLGGLVELGYGFAYRVLDAQFYGVAQRRRRVLVVANARSWRRAAAVLFERHSLSGHPAPRREAGESVANCLVDRPDRGGGNSEGQRLIPAWPAFEWQRGATQNLEFQRDFAPALVRKQTPAVAFSCKDHGADAGPIAPTLRSMGHDGSHANGGGQVAVAQSMAVRRLTPRECERLQGFPDDYTLIPWRKRDPSECPDGPRYKALGNSMAVPVMAWIGRRIAEVAASESEAA